MLERWLIVLSIFLLGHSFAGRAFAAASTPDLVVEEPSTFSAQLRDGRVSIRLNQSSFNNDFLIVRSPVGQQLVRWTRKGESIQLVAPAIETAIGPDIHAGAGLLGIHFKNWQPSILASFPITKTIVGGTVEFDATNLFLTSISGIPGIQGEIDTDRSHVENVSSYPNLIEIRATHTLISSSLSQFDLGKYEQRASSGEPLTLAVHWSIVQLPEQMMQARKFDPRMGYHIDERRLTSAARPTYSAAITRWRLEKTDPSGAVSEPKRPIVFYLAKNTPEWMKPWLKAGIESWLPAFEAAGFKNAIVVRDAPTDDPAFDEQSLRYSVIRIFDKTSVRRDVDPQGPVFGGGSIRRVSDPRTGELLKTDILLPLPNDLLQNSYFAFCGALDQRAKRIPLPQSLMGELFKALTAHEAGHAFGLRDGNYGEFVYPTERLRDKDWLAEMGFSPSVMSYSRCNYVAQPEDNVPPEYLIPRVGPADIHQIRWGYTPFPKAETWADEQAQLDAIVAQVDTAPWLSFLPATRGISPQLFNNAIDADDPVASTRLGVKNLQRVIKMLPEATLHEQGGDYLLEQMYFQVIKRWGNMMGHVGTLIGGYTIDPKSGTETGPVYTPIPADKQREAMAYLGEAAFQTPYYLIDPEITRRFEVSGTVNNIAGLQKRVLDDLLRLDRLGNFVEYELTATPGSSVYSLTEFLGDMRQAIWSELADRNATITPYRQRMQWAHIERLKSLSEPASASVTIRSALRNELDVLHGEIEDSLPKTKDQNTRAHLKLMLDELNKTVTEKQAR